MFPHFFWVNLPICHIAKYLIGEGNVEIWGQNFFLRIRFKGFFERWTQIWYLASVFSIWRSGTNCKIYQPLSRKCQLKNWLFFRKTDECVFNKTFYLFVITTTEHDHQQTEIVFSWVILLMVPVKYLSIGYMGEIHPEKNMVTYLGCATI